MGVPMQQQQHMMSKLTHTYTRARARAVPLLRPRLHLPSQAWPVPVPVRCRYRYQYKTVTGAVIRSENADDASTRTRIETAKQYQASDNICSHLDYVMAPTTSEVSAPIQGNIPEDFPYGTYVRNGPNSRFGAGTEHYFDGDGMIHGVTVKESGMHYFNSWVKGEGFKQEEKAGKKLYEGVLVNNGWLMLQGMLKNIFLYGALKTGGSKDTSNTNIIHHAGKTLACMEAQKPVRMSLTGDTINTEELDFDFGGQLVGNFTAHPKVDANSGMLLAFAYDLASKPHMRYTEIDQSGKVQHSVGIYNLERGTMAHDMAVTKNYTVLFDFPITFEASRILKGEFPVQFEKNSQASIGIIPRGGCEVRWFDIKRGGNAFHTVNAYEDDSGDIVVHALRSSPERDGYIFNDYSPSFLYEWKIKIESGKVEEQQLGYIGVEFPCITPKLLGKKANFAYMLKDSVLGPLKTWRFPPIAVVYNSILKYDLNTGEVVDQLVADYGLYIHEPSFVPKVGGVEEEDGYIVSFATDAEKKKSYFVIADAKNLSQGFVSTIEVPQKIAYGLHGCFIPSETVN